MTNPETPELLPCPFEWFNRRVNKMRHEGEGLTFYMSCSEIERMKEAERLYKQATGPSPCFICGGDGYICGEFQNEAMACTNCQDRPTPTAPENVNKQAEILHDKNICKEKTENFTKAPETAEALEALNRLDLYTGRDNKCEEWLSAYETIRTALQAETPRPAVKPLVWVERKEGGRTIYRASPMPTVHYRIAEQQDGYEVWYYNGDLLEYRKTLEEAQAAAEAHKDKMIREWLG